MEVKKMEYNIIYVWNGFGLKLDTIYTRETSCTIEDVAFVCVKKGKGQFIPCDFLTSEEFDEHMEDERFAYCDMSEYGLPNGFLLIENMKTNGIEVHS